MPPVSVIVPAFNAAGFLDTALASVAGQTVAPAEVVVVDDASTDDTAAVAAGWRDRLPLEVVTKARNEGLGAARRTGIAVSSAELIALLDADDAWLPDHLETMLAAYRRRPGIVTARNYRWFPTRNLARVDSDHRVRIPPPDAQRRRILAGNFLFVGTLFARADYDRAGGFRAMRRDEDWDLWIRMLRSGAVVSAPATATVLYRQHDDSLSADDGCLDADIELLEELREQVEADERPIVERALRRRHARRELLSGYAHVRSGRVAEARASWWRAMRTDRSVRGGLAVVDGSVTLKALACQVAPRRVVETRDRRVAS